MLGAIAGDIIGSVFEQRPIKTVEFELFSRQSTFTDDTVLTVATAHAILEKTDYASALKSYARRFPDAGYGISFYRWMMAEDSRPYNSWGNGSAMRVSPVGFAFDSVGAVLQEAEKSAAVTHNHPEGIKGAQATALAVYLGRTGAGKGQIRREIERRFGYDLNRRIDDIRPTYRFDISCQGTVPEAITAFLESENYENAVRIGISLGGDSDTIGCITGAVAHAHFGKLPESVRREACRRLPASFLQIIDRFNHRYGIDG
jgi:ADP-ribosylglycohydrolase